MFKFIPRKAKLLLLLIIILLIIEACFIGFIGYWREFFWEAVQKKDLHAFFLRLEQFAIVALILCGISSYVNYIISFTALLIRTELNNYAITLDHKSIEGGEQRIQDDCNAYPALALSMFVGLSRNVMTFLIFSFIVIVKLGVFVLLIPVLYALISTGVIYKVAKPLIKLNYSLQVAEAAYRRAVLKILKIKENYEIVINANKSIFKATKKLAFFQNFYNQITVIIPYVIIFPFYFSGKIIFGVFMQAASSISSVIDSMSYLINSFNDFNNWLSCRKRLKELGVFNEKK